MVTLAEIAADTSTVTISFGDKSLSVEYHPLLITDENMASLMDFGAMTADNALSKVRELSQILVDIIEAWDLQENDGQSTIPLTVPRLSKLSPVIKSRVIQAILGDINPETMAS